MTETEAKRAWLSGIRATLWALFAMALVAIVGGDPVDLLMVGLIVYHVRVGRLDSEGSP